MEQDKSKENLKEAIKLIKEGNKKEGGQILLDLVKSEPNNENAWLWLSMCLADQNKKIQCLEKVLEINPNNQKAKVMYQDINLSLQKKNNQDIENNKNQIDHISKESNQKNKKNLLITLNLMLILIVIGLLIVIFGVLLPQNKELTQLVQNTTIPESKPSPIPPTLIPTLSVEEIYRQKMPEILNELSEYDMDIFLFDQFLKNDDTIIIDLLAHNLLIEAGGNSSSDLITKILPRSNEMKNDAFTLVTNLSSITPPNEISNPHDQVLSCINFYLEKYSQISYAIENSQPFTDVEEGNTCNVYSLAIQKINDFLNMDEK